MGYSAKTALVTTLPFLAFISLISCSGGSSSGGGGGTTPVAAPTQTVVSGTVQAPGGAIAFFKQPSLGDLFESEVYAALTGLANVPDNTIVQLARLNPTATSFSVISTTTTSGGRYSFNLSSLGIPPANDLIVRVTGPSGREMRAFVVGTVADISPVSEAGYQLAIQSLGGASISNLTLQEVSNITNAVELIALTQNVGNAISVDQAVGLVRSAVGTHSQVTSFITSAGLIGQSTQGTGDIGNYFPFTQGNIWKYQGRRSDDGSSPLATARNVTISGLTNVNGVNTSVFLSGNSESYLLKDATGVNFYGSNELNPLTSQIVPVKTITFPLSQGELVRTLDKTGLLLNQDLDNDGINDTVDITDEYSVTAFESVVVPAGTFENVARLESREVQTYHSSAFGSTATITTTGIEWLAPGVGSVKSEGFTQSEGFSVDFTRSVTEELQSFVADGQGGGLRIQVSPLDVILPINGSVQLQAIAFDQSNSSLPGLTFLWTSSNPSVISVDPHGLVHGHSPGAATITASLGNLVSNAIPGAVKDIRVLNVSSTNFGNINDLVYDRTRQRIYASVSTSSGARANTIAVINPLDGTIGSSIPVGIEPTTLALSDDDHYLYVTLDHEFAVQRIDLSTMTADLRFSVGGIVGPNPGSYTEMFKASDIKVLPGNPLSVAIARYGQTFPAQRGVAIYDNGVQRPITTSFNTAPNQSLEMVGPNQLAFSNSASILYGLNWESNQNLFTMSISSTGVSVTQIQPQHRLCGGSLSFHQNRLYVSSEVVEPTSLSVLNIFPFPSTLPNPCGEAISDSSQNRVYFLTRNSSLAPTILTFNAHTFQLEASNELSFLGLQSIGNLIHWGADGLAFTAFPGKIYIFRTSLLQEQ